jgi:Dna[CI] antecedent, DciA
MLKSQFPMDSLAAALEKIVASSLRRSAAEGPILAWPLACGSAVAGRTRAVSFRSGVLWIEVPDAGWRAELRHLGARYLFALNRYSPAAVSRLEFVLPGHECTIDQDERMQKSGLRIQK